MPRPNAPRSLRSETNLARRIAHEREQRGMTYEGLAKRMTDVGCPIQPSAIFKIEKADPPRRITVDELVGFAEVFAVPVEQLLMPPEVLEAEALTDLFIAWESASRVLTAAKEEEAEARQAIEQYVASRPQTEEVLQRIIRAWADTWAPSPATTEAIWMHTFTGSERWSKLLDERLDERRKARGRG